MVNATELSLTTEGFVDTGLQYVGPLDELVVWRDPRTNRMVHAQPGEYIVKDTDGYPRRFSSDDFANLFEAAPAPDPVTSASATADFESVALAWTDNGASDDVHVYRNGTLIATVAGGTETYDDAPEPSGLPADTAVSYELRAVNSYGAESTGVTVDTGTAPATPPTDVDGSALGATVAQVTWTNTVEGDEIAVYRATSGAYSKVGSNLPAGTTHFEDVGLTTATGYHYKLRHVSAVGIESADSTVVDITTP